MARILDALPLRTAAAWTLWSLLYGAGLAGCALALAGPHPLLGFNATYLSLMALVALLERWLPHEPRWLADDGETADNLAHTLLTKGPAQLAAAVAASAGMAGASALTAWLPSPLAAWPTHWPLLPQVVLGLLLAELGLYAAHRAAHEWPFLWRFHALHHSVPRLWVLNTGRFHLVDTLLKMALGQLPLFLLGAPLPVFLWLSAVTAINGLLTHCNLALRTGWLDGIFSTPQLHRWHHSRVLAEGNRNYGENLVLWDRLFGTYHNPPRRPPADIGIPGRIERGWLRQLVQPFTPAGARAIHGMERRDG